MKHIFFPEAILLLCNFIFMRFNLKHLSPFQLFARISKSAFQNILERSTSFRIIHNKSLTSFSFQKVSIGDLMSATQLLHSPPQLIYIEPVWQNFLLLSSLLLKLFHILYTLWYQPTLKAQSLAPASQQIKYIFFI